LKVRDRYEHRNYAHCETGTVVSLLRHYGLEISEPMVFGLASGLMFAFLPFVKIMGGMPIVAYRSIPRSIIRGIQSRLGVKFEVRRYRDEGKAMEDLSELIDQKQVVGVQTSAFWLPYFPREMRIPFNAHNIVVYGKENGEYLVSEPALEEPTRIKPQDLRNARFARGILAPKGLMYYPTYIPEKIDFNSLIPKSIKWTNYMLLSAPPPCGVRGIFYLANYIEKLGGKRDEKYIRSLLGHIALMQEEIGTGGGGFRFLYAAFLAEAYERMEIPVLREAYRKMTEAGDLWRNFALVCARTFKRKDSEIDLLHIANLLRMAGKAEKEVHLMLRKIS
jgi:hypothetical protein